MRSGSLRGLILKLPLCARLQKWFLRALTMEIDHSYSLFIMGKSLRCNF